MTTGSRIVTAKPAIYIEANEKAKQIIIDTIVAKQGCKGTELVSEVVGKIYEKQENIPDIPELIQELEDTGEIIAVCYVLPQMDYRIKAFYLPKGSQVSISGSPTPIQ